MSDNQTKTLENGAIKSSGQDLEFNEIVNESRARIAGQSSEPVQLKRGRGRPRKNGPPEVHSAQPNPSGHSVPAPQPPPDISQFLVAPLIAVSKIPASKHNIPELALDKTEALACAESLNALMNAFVPNVNSMSPKTAAVISACTTFGAIAFSKYHIYLEKREIQTVSEEMPENFDPNSGQHFQTEAVNAPLGSINAADAFRRRP